MDNDTLIIAGIILFFFAGNCDGTAETLKFHSAGFFHVFKKANINFWDIDVSWMNKYKDNDPKNGPKFWQSDKALVALTDGYHLMRLIKNNLIILASILFLAVAMIIGGREIVWYMLPIAYALCYASYTIGFTIVYDWLFGYKK